MMETKRFARQVCENYPQERCKNVLRLCFQSLQLEWLHAKYTRARGETVATMLVMQKYLYPAVYAVKRIVTQKHQNQYIQGRVESFKVSWRLIYGYTSVERNHRITRLQKGAVNVACASYFAKHCDKAIEALHENKKLLSSLRNIRQKVIDFRLSTAGRKQFVMWWRVVGMTMKVRRDEEIVDDFLVEVQMRRPFALFREYAQSNAQQYRVLESSDLLLRVKLLKVLFGGLLQYHLRTVALLKWRRAGDVYHTRREQSLAIHCLASRAQLCLYMKTCMIRGFHFYYSNAMQDCFEILKVRVKSSILAHIGEEVADEWIYQKTKRKGLHALKATLALGRRARLLLKWSIERKLRARLALAYQAWIYAYVKRCTLRIALDKKLQHERTILQNDSRARKTLERAADWMDEMHNLDRFHRGEHDVQELEHSLGELRSLAIAKLREARTIDFGIIRMKLRAIRAIGAPQRKGQTSSLLNQGIESQASELRAQREQFNSL